MGLLLSRAASFWVILVSLSAAACDSPLATFVPILMQSSPSLPTLFTDGMGASGEWLKRTTQTHPGSNSDFLSMDLEMAGFLKGKTHVI